MELKNYDLSGLEKLWQASKGNPNFNIEVEEELQKRIVENEECSREHIYKICNIEGKLISIKFIPTSKSYKVYGDLAILFNKIIESEELTEIEQNFLSVPEIKSYGIIKTNLLNEGDYPKGHIDKLSKIGFDTHDILSIMNR